METLGAVLEVPAKQHYQSILCIYLKTGPNRPNRQCCLAGSSKQLPGFSFLPNIYHMWNPLLCSPHIFWIYYFGLSRCERLTNVQTKLIIDIEVEKIGVKHYFFSFMNEWKATNKKLSFPWHTFLEKKKLSFLFRYYLLGPHF